MDTTLQQPEKGMTRADLAASVVDATGLSQAQADAAIAAALDGIKGALRKGDGVTLIGFGTFSVSKHETAYLRHSRGPASKNQAESGPGGQDHSRYAASCVGR